MRLILFDCDGTLVDSEALIVSAMRTAFAAHALPAPDAADVRAIIGLSLPRAIVRLMPQGTDIDSTVIASAYREAHRALTSADADGEPFFPGVREMLDALHREETLFGVVTGKSRRGALRVLERHGLTTRFPIVRTADDCPSKPSPAMVLEAMDEAGVPPTRTIVIGDTTFDMEMARAAGTVGIGVSWGSHTPVSLHRAGAWTVAHAPHEVVGAVDRLLGVSRAAARSA